MADQGKVCITMTAPASSARGTILSGAGTKSATLAPAGVLYDSTESTDTLGEVQIAGTCKVLLGGTVTAGAAVKSDASGAAIAATLGTDDGLVAGIMLEGGAAGELRDMIIK
jgi:hypothetical protein